MLVVIAMCPGLPMDSPFKFVQQNILVLYEDCGREGVMEVSGMTMFTSA
jgi:hypothetical protein